MTKALSVLLLPMITISMSAFSQHDSAVHKSIDTSNINSSKFDTIPSSIIFVKVEQEAQFPGGQNGWIDFLRGHLSYPEKAQREKIQGVVVIQFIVDKDGTVSNIQAISGPDELKEISIKVIRESGKWIPARQNGHEVKSYKKQPITFRLEYV